MKSSASTQNKQVWFTQAELCRYLGISHTTLNRWTHHKNFPKREMQNLGAGRYDIRKVEAFIRQRI